MDNYVSRLLIVLANDKVLCEIIEGCPMLRILNLEWIGSVTDETLNHLSCFFPKQKEVLNLKNCSQITDNGVKVVPFAVSCHYLTWLRS